MVCVQELNSAVRALRSHERLHEWLATTQRANFDDFRSAATHRSRSESNEGQREARERGRN